MIKHLYVIQDMRSLNCAEPLCASNIHEMKRSFAVAFSSRPIDRAYLSDTRVLEIADISFDDNTNVPIVSGFPAPSVAFYGSDPDVLELIDKLYPILHPSVDLPKVGDIE